jgi:hypothetical protein
MYKNDMFEEGSLNKLDDKIHFNLKNIENIIIGNLKPALNRLEVYIKENYFRNNKLNEEKDKNFINIFTSTEILLNDLIEISSEYRNFMAWLHSLSSQYSSNEMKSNNPQPQTKKNNLDKIYIKNDSLLKFIQEEKYNLKSISTFFEEKKDNNENNENNDLNKNNANVINFSSIDSNNNIFSKKYLEKKKINFNSIINKEENKDDKDKNNKINEKYLLTKLDSMKLLIKEEISTNYTLLSKEVQNLPQDFLVLSGIKNEINKFNVICNESNEYVFYFTSKEDEKNILFIIAINMNSQCKFAKINFSYEMNIKILDFKITIKNELLLLVKTPMKNNFNDNFEEIKEFKFTLISSDLSNYSFYDVKNDNGDKLEINFGIYNGSEDIKIDELADVECTDDSFLALTGKGFISLVDNSLNKITIIDLIQDK